MKSTLRILLPITLPTVMSGRPVTLAPMDTASSGELVPRATTVNPMISGGMPSANAMRDAPRTSPSAPAINNTNPATNWITITALITRSYA